MALSLCNSAVDGTQRELTQHGSISFPAACYHDDLSREIVPWHWHEEWEAVVIERGKTLVAAGKEKYVLREGEGFFVNSGILHSCWDWENSGCRYHSLVFHPRLVGGSLDSVFYQKYVAPLMRSEAPEFIHLKPDTPWQREALDAIEEAWQAGFREEFGYEFQIRGSLSRMTALLQRSLPNAAESRSRKAMRDAQRIKDMLQFIHTHCAEPLDTQQIAGAASLSESECLRCFHVTIGTTPMRYVRQYRIQRAAELLHNTTERVGDIAQQCGFSDVSYFVKTFRELKGCAPGVFRKNKHD